MLFPPILLRIASLPANTLNALNCLSEGNDAISEEAYSQLYYETVTQLCQLSKNPQLLNGLQMSSHSLAGRVQKIIDQLPATLRKKEQQTARSLWQILSRMAGKTSPFSSFTHLGQVAENEDSPGTVHHRFRLNNVLLGQLLEVLRYHPPFFEKQKLRLNYTTKLVGTEYVFLHNTRNVESVQNVDSQEVIDLIVSHLKDGKLVSFQELTAFVLKVVDADQTEIDDYIFSLAEYGLLVWELVVAPTAENWWGPLAEQLLSLREDSLCQKIGNILIEASAVLETIAIQTPEGRAQIQQQYFNEFKNIWEENRHLIPSVNSTEVLEEGLKRITETSFLLKPETVFYEDTRLAIKDFWTENNWRPLRKKMAVLSQLLLPLTSTGRDDYSMDFYQKNFGQSITLWVFYQKWLPVARARQDAENTQDQKIAINLKNKLATLSHSESMIHLTPEFLRSISPDSSLSQYVGSLVLPFQDEGKDQLFLDTFIPANARLAGRFLSLFPASDTNSWRSFHKVQASDKLWIENQDYSFFNANVHPPLLPKYLQIPSLIIAGNEEGIPITEIMVQLDQEKKCLFLTYQEKMVEVINLSVEATDNRSGLFQLLCQFEATVPSKNLLLKTINELNAPSDQGIIRYLRVIYDQQIILQRATWFFPKKVLPFKSKGTTTTAYYNQLINWKKENNLPTQFYYTLNFNHQTERIDTRRNEHKPQFFDFRNPLSIDLFFRDLKKVNHFLKIEEMLPLPEQLIEMDGVKRMVEGLVMS